MLRGLVRAGSFEEMTVSDSTREKFKRIMRMQRGNKIAIELTTGRAREKFIF